MDLNDIRSIVTVLSLVVFIGIVRWAWSRNNVRRFDEAAELPFADESAAGETTQPAKQGTRP